MLVTCVVYNLYPPLYNILLASFIFTSFCSAISSATWSIAAAVWYDISVESTISPLVNVKPLSTVAIASLYSSSVSIIPSSFIFTKTVLVTFFIASSLPSSYGLYAFGARFMPAKNAASANVNSDADLLK